MKTYEEFTEMMLEKIPEYMPEEMQMYGFELRPIPKTNGIMLDGIVMSCPDRPSEFVSPIIYPAEFYRLYSEGGQPEETILNHAAKIFRDSMGTLSKPMISDIRDVSKWIPVIVNTEKNRELLQHCPHRRFGKTDCSVMYKALLTGQSFGDGIASVTNEMAEYAGVTEPEIFEMAKDNLNDRIPVVVKDFEKLMETNGMPIIDLLSNEPITADVVLVSNYDGYYGAGMIVDSEVLEKLSERMNGNLIIIPSSIHEVLVSRENMKESRMGIKDMETILQEINKNEVSEKDFLSDHVFLYDRKEKTLTMPCVEKNKEKERDER